MPPKKDIPYNLTFTLKQLLIVIGMGLILWTFYVWRQLISKTLAYLFYNRHIIDPRDMESGIVGPADHLNISYLDFLEEFSKSFRRPLRYFWIAFLFSIYAFYYLYFLLIPAIRDIIIKHINDTVFIISFITHLIIIAIINFASIYCLGVISWVLYITGSYIMKLLERFDFNIEPLHPDKCGGLKVLGNFCFGLVSPIFIGSAFFIGYIYVALRDPKGGFDLITVYLILFIIVAYGLFVAVPSFFIPLWSIHKKMLGKREKDNERYARNMEKLRQEIQDSLIEGKTKEAENMKKQMDLMQGLHTTYPQWPFNIGSRLLSIFLAIIGSLLLGFITALQQPLVQAILQQNVHKP